MAGFNLGTAQGRIAIDSSQLKEADISLRQAGRGMVGFGVAAVAAFGYVVKVASDFEKEMDFVQAVTGESEAGINRLKQAALDLGKQGPYGPREVANSFVDLAKAGLTTTEIIEGAGKAAISLAAAGDLPLGSAAEIAVNTMRTFGVEAKDLGGIIDTMAGAANASTIDVEDLATSLKYAGALAKATGVSFGDTAAALAILGNQGIKGSTAGTSLRRIFLNMTPTTEKAAKAMKEMGIITKDGTNKFIDAAGNTKPLAEVFQVLQDATKGLPADKVKDLFNTIFGARAVPAAIIFAQSGSAGFKDMMDQISRADAADVAAKRLDNLAGSIKKLRAAIEAVLIGAGTPFQDFLKGIADGAREVVLWFGRLPRPIQTGILAFIALGGVLALLAGGFLLTVGNIVRAIRVAGELATVLPKLMAGIRALNGSLLSLAANPVVLLILAIIVVIALLVYAFYKLYTENEKFRAGVQATWEWMQKAWDAILRFFKGLPDLAKNAWKEAKKTADEFWDGLVKKVYDAWHGIQSGVADVGRTIVDFFQSLPGKIGGFFAAIGSAVGGGVSSALSSIASFFSTVGGAAGGAFTTALSAAADFFQSLPGLAGNAIGAIGNFFSQLPRTVGFAVGFMIGSAVKMFYDFVTQLIGIGASIVSTIGGWFSDAIPAVLSALANLMASVIAWAGDFTTEGFHIGLDFVTNLVSWFLALPGRIVAQLTMITAQLIAWGASATAWALQTGLGIFNGILQFLIQLPAQIQAILMTALQWILTIGAQWVANAIRFAQGMVTGIFNIVVGLPNQILGIWMSILNTILSMVPRIWSAAFSIGHAIYDAITKGIGNLFETVRDRFMSVISGIQNLAGAAFNAAKSFAGGLWDGFKSGLGIGSPSFIEESAWKMQDNLTDVLKNLQGQVRGFQAVGADVSATNGTGLFGGAARATGTTQTYVTNHINVPINGPVIRREEDVTKLSRRLTADIAQSARAAG